MGTNAELGLVLLLKVGKCQGT